MRVTLWLWINIKCFQTLFLQTWTNFFAGSCTENHLDAGIETCFSASWLVMYIFSLSFDPIQAVDSFPCFTSIPYLALLWLQYNIAWTGSLLSSMTQQVKNRYTWLMLKNYKFSKVTILGFGNPQKTFILLPQGAFFAKIVLKKFVHLNAVRCVCFDYNSFQKKNFKYII